MEEVPSNSKTIRKAPYNHGIEKWILRKAFDVEKGMLNLPSVVVIHQNLYRTLTLVPFWGANLS